ncbi:MAG: hypothetical protein WBD31_10055 [Rubripirellula sp.]
MKPSKLEILAYEDTTLGPLCLRRRELLSEPGTMVTEVTLNHEFLMSSYNTDSEREISSRAILHHGGSGLRALIGGLGLGYTAAEMLRHDQVESVEVVEFLQPVIDWMNGGLVPLSKTINRDERLIVTLGDVYGRLMGPPTTLFDVIVIDVDHSPDDTLGETEHPFYTAPGLAKAKQHLRPGGVLAVWSYAESSSFSSSLENTFTHVTVEPITTENKMVGHQQTDWLFFACDSKSASTMR